MDYVIETYTVLVALHETVTQVGSVVVFSLGFLSDCLLLTAFSFWKW